MVSKLIEKKVDIYQYPEEFEGNSGSITIGDLHGNAVKLAHVLFRHKIIKFKDEVSNPAEQYNQFVTTYEKMADYVSLYDEQLLKLYTQKEKAEEYEKSIELYHRLKDKDPRTPDEEFQLADLDITILTDSLKESKRITDAANRTLSNIVAEYKTMIAQFNQFMGTLEIDDQKALVRLIGDEFADRGSNDYFTLRLLGFLHDNKVEVHTLISNHGNEFVTGYENLINRHYLEEVGYVHPQQKPSFAGLRILLDEQVITESEVTSLINKAYKPSLKILDYTLNEDGITLFTHAPVRFDSIQDIASQLGVDYDDSTKEALAKTIDKINQQFAQIVEENRVHEYCTVDDPMDLADMSLEERKAYPLIYMIWNRWNENKETEDARPASNNDYKIHYVHGHDPFQSPMQHITNLDTPIGKGSRKDVEVTRKHLMKMPDSLEKDELLETINNIMRYKVLDSSDKGLTQEHDAGHTAPTKSGSLSDYRTSIILGISSAAGLLLGGALAATELAPAGLAVLGTAVFTGLIGYGIAKVITAAPIDTLNKDSEKEQLIQEQPESSSSTAILESLRGTEKTQSMDKSQEDEKPVPHSQLFSKAEPDKSPSITSSEESQKAMINRQ
ncbi:Dot/Icm T4SS effector Wip [Legionella shakespearei]|uniref:Substrate of the Dot/Icm secretion system n=1 Tax=Legionella shakespearei DSM 23087 TaxID=1122169 RepID=A0A0W0YZY7_9GAMM|nr:Dot/Icm T4SS effector Wip [Legionella shakespearei]KTD62449.1 substrate of the Dot/Icm secretion system [Legionella shakespearei DSM 23087]